MRPGFEPRTKRNASRVVVGLLPLLLTAGVEAQDWQRRAVGSSGASLEVPASWDIQAREASVLRAKDAPTGEPEANLSVHAFAALTSVEAWKDHHKASNLEASYPEATIESVRELSNGATLYYLTHLGGEREGFSLFEALIPLASRFVVVSLVCDEDLASVYELIVLHMVGSVSEKPFEEAAEVASRPGEARHRVHRRGFMTWHDDFDAAFEEARSRNVPVMIVFNHDSQPVCHQIVKVHYQDPRLVELSRSLVCLAASVNDHVAQERGAAPDGTCPWFPGSTCDGHRKAESAARQTYLRTPTVVVPQHLFCSPEGRILARREYMLSRDELEGMMREAIVAVRNEIGSSDFDLLGEPLARFKSARSPEERQDLVMELFGTGRFEAANHLASAIVDRGMRKDFIDLLAGIGKASHPEGLRYALAAANHSSVDVRREAVIALGRIGSDDAVPVLLERMKKETRLGVKSHLYHALSRCGRNDEEVASRLVVATRRGSTSLRVNATVALHGFPGCDRARNALLAMLEKSSSPDLKAAAAWTLGYLEVPEAVPLVKKTMSGRKSKKGSYTSVLQAALDRLEGRKGSAEEYRNQALCLTGCSATKDAP